MIGLAVAPSSFIDNQTIQLEENKLYVKIDNQYIINSTSGLTIADSLKETPNYVSPTTKNVVVYVNQKTRKRREQRRVN